MAAEAPPAPAPSRSLARRLVLAASAVLFLFVVAVGAILEAAIRDSLEETVRQRLLAHVYTLLAVVDIAPDGTITMPEALPEPRFDRPDSGLYALFQGPGDRWTSPSAMGEDPRLPDSPLPPGETRFLRRYDIGPERAYVFRQGFAWEGESGADLAFVLSVAEHERSVEEQIARFRQTLWLWLAGAGAVLLTLQLAVLRWGLRPVRRLAEELAAVKRGDREAIDGDVPRELAVLTRGLNAFIASERKHLERYRNSLADLAHSLKTPLAVLRAAVDRADRDELLAQVDRMDELVAYQLKRARTAGQAALSRPEVVADVVAPLVRSLAKVHAARSITCETYVAPRARFFGDRADLMELLGNLLDNAFKWARTTVRITANSVSSSEVLRPGLVVTVEDDGPGLPPGEVERLLQRGARADERVPGHGIGLAIVADISDAYGGTIRFDHSPLGGASVTLAFPEA